MGYGGGGVNTWSCWWWKMMKNCLPQWVLPRAHKKYTKKTLCQRTTTQLVACVLFTRQGHCLSSAFHLQKQWSWWQEIKHTSWGMQLYLHSLNSWHGRNVHLHLWVSSWGTEVSFGLQTALHGGYDGCKTSWVNITFLCILSMYWHLKQFHLASFNFTCAPKIWCCKTDSCSKKQCG